MPPPPPPLKFLATPQPSLVADEENLVIGFGPPNFRNASAIAATCQIIFPRKILGSFSANYGPADVMTFFFFGLHLLLGGEMDICGHDDPQRTRPPFA